MQYEPLSYDKFIERLNSGVYETVTAARRAIGKSSWADAKREQARKHATAYFGVEDAPAAKRPAKKAAAKSGGLAPAKKSPGRPRKTPKVEHVEHASAEAHAAEAYAADVTELPPALHALETRKLTVADVRKNPFQTIQLAEHAVQSGTSVLNALTEAKRMHPELETESAHEQAINTIQAALRLTSSVMEKLSEGLRVPDAIKDVLGKPTNGIHVPDPEMLPGKASYVAPAAEA